MNANRTIVSPRRAAERVARFAIGFAFAASMLVTGCSSAPKDPQQPKQPAAPKEGASLKLNQWLSQQNFDVPDAIYRVAPPDKIRIAAPGIKEIDGQEAVVRPDGKLELNLVGEVQVGGLTPAEISEVIAQKLATYYKAETLDVSVQITEFKSQHFYVFGQVDEPGVKAYTGRDTLLRALADAKLNEKAWPQMIVLVRPNEDLNVKQRVTVDVKEMYENGSSKQNFMIESGDVIYVPLSPMAKLEETAKKVFMPIMPATQIGMIARGGI
jgi:protein involved in polysaccharide export with SLBB domain